jgi:hypothetical protein
LTETAIISCPKDEKFYLVTIIIIIIIITNYLLFEASTRATRPITETDSTGT